MCEKQVLYLSSRKSPSPEELHQACEHTQVPGSRTLHHIIGVSHIKCILRQLQEFDTYWSEHSRNASSGGAYTSHFFPMNLHQEIKDSNTRKNRNWLISENLLKTLLETESTEKWNRDVKLELSVAVSAQWEHHSCSCSNTSWVRTCLLPTTTVDLGDAKKPGISTGCFR